MARKFLTPIDLNKLELQNAVIQNLMVAPDNPAVGQVYFDTTLGYLRTYAGIVNMEPTWLNASIGNDGAQGTTGAQGTQGETGTQGIQGETGAQGIQGETGEQGIQGETGTQGIQGEQGIQGYTGEQGIQGAEGAQGIQGETGTQGIQGENAGILSVAGPLSVNGGTGELSLGIGSGLDTDGDGKLIVDTTTIATKAYVDATAQGLDVKASVKVASTAQISLSGPTVAVIDGISISDGNRILVKNQDDTSENGIYVKDGLSLVRPDDALPGTTLTKGAFVFVENGTNAGKGFVVSDLDAAVGSQTVVWTQFSETGNYITSVGSNLSVTDGELDLGANVVITDATQTLSNKTLESPTVTVSNTTDYFNSAPPAYTYTSYNTLSISGVGQLSIPGGATLVLSGGTGKDGTYTVTYTTYNAGDENYINVVGSGTGPWGRNNTNLSGGNIHIFTTDVTTVSSTEISYLDGVTSNIQDQLDAKVNKYTETITGDGSTTSFSIVYGWEGWDADVSVYAIRNSYYYDLVETDVTIALESGSYKAIVSFAVAPLTGESYRVVVTGSAGF